MWLYCRTYVFGDACVFSSPRLSSSSFTMPALKRARILDLLCAELPDDVVSYIDAFAVPRAVQFVAFAKKYGVV